MTLKDWQKKVDDWIQSYGVRYFSETTNGLMLMEEVGELSRHIARVYGEQSYKKPLTRKEQKSAIEEEMGDVLFVLTCLANQMDIDLEEILAHNMNKKTKRDHTRHQENRKLHD